jgi:membrane complex biogenesis BtpA family protein
MLTRDEFHRRFGGHPLFGMVHLEPLPGSPLFSSMNRVIEAALSDAVALSDGGAAGIIIENFGDRPFAKSRVEPETVAAMTRVVTEIARQVQIPLGINVLRNDAVSALSIAAATGAAFIRVNVHTGAMVTDQGVIEGTAHETLRKRSAIAPAVLIFADYLVKHAAPLGPVSASDLRERGLADALIVTGPATGAAADPQRLHFLRAEIDAPILIGSGVNAENAHSFHEADGAIVGSSLKRDGRVDRELVRAVVGAWRG